MAQIKPENLSSNNLMIIMLLISLLVVGISGIVAKMLVTNIVRDTKVISAKTKANNQLKDNIEKAPQLVSAYQAMGTQATVLADALPTTVDLPSLLVSMENMAGDSGIKLKAVNSSPQATTDTTGTAASSASGATPQVYAFSVTFDGNYGSLQKFLGDLEKSARPMRVTSIQVNGSGSALSGEVDLQTYYQDKATLPFSTETIK